MDPTTKLANLLAKIGIALLVLFGLIFLLTLIPIH